MHIHLQTHAIRGAIFGGQQANKVENLVWQIGQGLSTIHTSTVPT